MASVALKCMVIISSIPLCHYHVIGPGRDILKLSVCPSVHQSVMVRFRTVTRRRIAVFPQKCADVHHVMRVYVLYAFWYIDHIDGMVFGGVCPGTKKRGLGCRHNPKKGCLKNWSCKKRGYNWYMYLGPSSQIFSSPQNFCYLQKLRQQISKSTSICLYFLLTANFEPCGYFLWESRCPLKTWLTVHSKDVHFVWLWIVVCTCISKW